MKNPTNLPGLLGALSPMLNPLTQEAAGVIQKFIDSYVEVKKNNAMTEVALKKIEADLEKDLTMISEKSKKELTTINILGNQIISVIQSSDIASSDKTNMISIFTNAVVHIAEL